MATSTRRPAPIVSNFSRDRRVAGDGNRSSPRPTFEDRSVRILALILSVALLWAIDTFVLKQAMWTAVSEEIAPSLRRWHWAWTTYWKRGT